MSVGLIVAIIVVVIAVVAFVVFGLPRIRRAREQRQLEQRRSAVVEGHREVAEDRQARAELAEREAARQRAEADLHQARARVHERGLADDQLRDADDPDEVVSRRETFADRERPGEEPAEEPGGDRPGAPVDPATRRPTQS
jgi:FtsZ-interacting cell division protein ZipA